VSFFLSVVHPEFPLPFFPCFSRMFVLPGAVFPPERSPNPISYSSPATVNFFFFWGQKPFLFYLNVAPFLPPPPFSCDPSELAGVAGLSPTPFARSDSSPSLVSPELIAHRPLRWRPPPVCRFGPPPAFPPHPSADLPVSSSSLPLRTISVPRLLSIGLECA